MHQYVVIFVRTLITSTSGVAEPDALAAQTHMYAFKHDWSR